MYANSTKILGPVTSSIIGKEIKREKKERGEESFERRKLTEKIGYTRN